MKPEEVPAELVEKAARAVWDLDPAVAAGDWPAWDDAQRYTDSREDMRDEARHALAAVLPEVQAQALRDAADEWQRGEWANAPRRADRVQERIANGQYVGEWLRERAARLTTTTEEPTR